MSTAKRLYGKKFNPFSEEPPKNSPFFKSKVLRNINQQPDCHLGPGQYQISLPLVKPTFQTIMKNDNTVIVKFNSHCSNAFQSKSPRFRYNDEKYQERDNSFRRPKYNNLEMENPEQPENQDNIYGLTRELSRALLISQMQENKAIQLRDSNNNNKMKKRNYSLCRQNSTKRKYLHHTLSTRQQTINNQQEPMQHRTLPVASRLHNLQPNIIQTKKLQSNRYNPTIKSTEWSKYKLQRKSFVDEIVTEQQPGPGTYALKQPKFKTYNQRADITSWQFNSKTSRCPFDETALKQQLHRQFFTHGLSQSMRDERRIVQDPEEIQRKVKILNKKISRKRIFGLGKSKQNLMASTYIEPNLAFEFTSIHSPQKLFWKDEGVYQGS